MKIKTKDIFLIIGVCLFLLILFLLFIDPALLYQNTVFYNFQSRDIERAKNLINGHLIFYGPEMTGGGVLPGPLYYVLLGLGMLLKPNWIGAWWTQFAVFYFAAIAGAYFFSKKHSRSLALLWLALFATAPFTSWFIKIFLNVSSLSFFAVISYILILKSVEGTEQDRKRSFWLACLFTGAGLQFHFSIVFLFFALLFMHLLSKKLKLPSVSKKTLAQGLLIFIAPSIPFLTWSLLAKYGVHFGEPAFYTGQAEKSITSILYLIKSGLNIPLTKLYYSVVQKLTFSVPFPLVLLLLANIRNNKLSERVQKLSFKPLLICLFFASIPYLNWYLSPQARRYSMPFYIGLIFLALFLYSRIIESKTRLKVFVVLALITQIGVGYFLCITSSVSTDNLILGSVAIFFFFILVLLFDKAERDRGLWFFLSLFLILSLGLSQKLMSPEKTLYAKSSEGYMPSYNDWVYMVSEVYTNTGWDYSEARGKLFYIGHHVNQDPELFYEGMKGKLGKLKDHLISPDGFFISNRFGDNQNNRNRKITNPKGWLLRQNLHEDILQALEDGDISLGENLSEKNLIVPYWVVNTKNIPKHIHNSGLGYRISKDDLRLGEIKEREGVKKLENNKYLFKWNECEDQHAYCSTGTFLEITKTAPQKYMVNVKVVGATISQITPWISPNWTQSWTNPYLDIKCGNDHQVLTIATSIGFNREYSHSSKTPFFAGNNSFIAPFERTFPLDCPTSISEISIGRKGSQIDMIVGVKTLPAKLLSIKTEAF